jgi:hypothetical protein
MHAYDAGAATEPLHPNTAEQSSQACCPVDLPARLPPERMHKMLAVLRRVLVEQALRELGRGGA